jgi:hypothetical protein
MTRVYARVGAQGAERVLLGYYCERCKVFKPLEELKLRDSRGNDIRQPGSVYTVDPQWTPVSRGVSTADRRKHSQNGVKCEDNPGGKT